MFFRYLLNMLQLLLSPRRGWEDIAVCDTDPAKLLRRGFVPLILVTSLTCLPELWYHSGASVVGVVESMIGCFVKFLVSYYVAGFCFSLYVPACTGGELSPDKNHTFILYSLGLLCVFNILTNLLPMVPDMLYLLPIYVLFIMWRAISYMEIVFDGVMKFMILCVGAVIVPPFLFQYLFSLLWPV